MSLDLLQAFGDPSCDESANPWATSSTHGVKNRQIVEDDDFGDFEQPEPPEWPVQPTNRASHRGAPANSEDYQQNSLLIDATKSHAPPSPSFQQANAPLKLAIPPEPDHTTPTNTEPKESTPITAWPSYGRDRAKSFGKPLPLSPYADDDDWGDFEEEPHVENLAIETAQGKPPKAPVLPKEASGQTGSLLDLADTPQKQTLPSAEIVKASRNTPLSMELAAPSNIPPPSVLLSVISSILQSLSADIRDIVASAGTAPTGRESSNTEPMLESLTSKVATIKASARITAGRKLRWKRDTHLAQSMRMGPANAGKTSGMKLTGVDRTETRREDQEAAEVVRLGKQQTGSLKSQIARINAQQSEIEFVLPDISENMPIRTAKVGEGALTAPKCCFLCGLKRDERIARLDVNVEDSFGEWWVDFWGHVDCIRFWEEHRDSLKQR